MIEEQAVVRKVISGNATVELQHQSGCHSCQMNGVCGSGALGRLLGFRPHPLIIGNQQNLKAGDRVTVGLAEEALVVAGLITYLLPVVSMLLLALIADVGFDAGNLVTVITAFSGLLLGLLFSSWLVRRSLAHKLQPRVVRQNLVNL